MLKRKFVIVQPHSDDAYLSCMGLLKTSPVSKVILTLEKDMVRVEEDRKLERIFNNLFVTYLLSGLPDKSYKDYRQKFKTVDGDSVVAYYSEKYGDEFLKLIQHIGEILDTWEDEGYFLILPLGIGHPFHVLIYELFKDKADYFYREFPHAWKRKNLLAYEERTRDKKLVYTFDDKETLSQKEEIFKSVYKSQSAFAFFEASKFRKLYTEELWENT